MSFVSRQRSHHFIFSRHNNYDHVPRATVSARKAGPVHDLYTMSFMLDCTQVHKLDCTQVHKLLNKIMMMMLGRLQKCKQSILVMDNNDDDDDDDQAQQQQRQQQQ